MEKINRNYIHKAQSVSTNTELKELIKESHEPLYTVIFADSQTGGRGRQGRTFFSPTGGAYFSAAYPLSGSEKNIPFFTLLTGLAVRAVLQELCGVQTQIKWPNDIYLKGKKLCGILCELVSRGKDLCAVAGVGINLTMEAEEIPPELREKITALSLENAEIPQVEDIVKAVIEKLDGYVYRRDCLNTLPKNLIDELNSCSFLRGKTVYYNGKKALCGEINPDGSIMLRFEDREERIFFGEIVRSSD